jgi:HD-GYP domain-containing protein (c-di-GMP phosphodiesterase class II)
MWGTSSTESSGSGGEANAFVKVSLTRLTPGVRLKQPIYDDTGVLLLAGGVVLTASVLARLAQRGLNSVRVHRSELDRLSQSAFARNARSAQSTSRAAAAESSVRLGTGSSVQYVAPPVASLGGIRCSGEFLKKVPRHGTRPFDPTRVRDVSKNYHLALREVVGLYDSRRGIRAGEIDTLQGISESCTTEILADIDAFVHQGIVPENDKYPPRHGQQTAMLAIAMGVNLGIEKKDLIDLGVGCLAHDLGMLYLRDNVFSRQESLSSMTFLEITKHPGITFDLMRDVEQMANTPRIVAYQLHERCNGEGYPRGRVSSQIHPLAKIAAVADSYLAMISPRPHREGIPPYLAMERLLKGTRQGLYDPLAIRSLLRTVSLFPIGSFVELNDGRHARVVRTCGDMYASPVVETWSPGQMASAEVLDLSEHQNIQVVRTLTENESPALTMDDRVSLEVPVVETPDGMLVPA